jgi:hypothetical protein
MRRASDHDIIQIVDCLGYRELLRAATTCKNINALVSEWPERLWNLRLFEQSQLKYVQKVYSHVWQKMPARDAIRISMYAYRRRLLSPEDVLRFAMASDDCEIVKILSLAGLGFNAAVSEAIDAKSLVGKDIQFWAAGDIQRYTATIKDYDPAKEMPHLLTNIKDNRGGILESGQEEWLRLNATDMTWSDSYGHAEEPFRYIEVTSCCQSRSIADVSNRKRPHPMSLLMDACSKLQGCANEEALTTAKRAVLDDFCMSRLVP